MEKMPKLTPGSKIYQLFDHRRVLVEGRDELFFIQVRKIRKIAPVPTGSKESGVTETGTRESRLKGS